MITVSGVDHGLQYNLPPFPTIRGRRTSVFLFQFYLSPLQPRCSIFCVVFLFFFAQVVFLNIHPAGRSIVLFSGQFFMGLECQPNAQPPIWRTRVSLFVWNLTLDLSGMGGPASSYAVQCICLLYFWLLTILIVQQHNPINHFNRQVFCFFFAVPYGLRS
jgi:hypothetical protein